MANDVPPQEGPKPFYLREKIGEMVKYGYPLTMRLHIHTTIYLNHLP